VVAAAAESVAGEARLWALLTLFASGAALGAGATPSAFDFGGRYAANHPNGNVDGERYTTTDTALIVPIDARHALFEMELAFFNGHSCSIGGRATLEGSTLVYRNPEMSGYGDGGPCTLRIRRRGGRLAWDDAGSCTGHCGARGSLRDGGMTWSSRRPVSRTERQRLWRDYEGNGSRQ
jgi:hypothetical protein